MRDAPQCHLAPHAPQLTRTRLPRADLGELQRSTWSANTDPEKPGVTLSYGDGQQGKSTELMLVCDPAVSGLDNGPSFIGHAPSTRATAKETQARGDVFRFEWVTSAGCPLNATTLR